MPRYWRANLQWHKRRNQRNQVNPWSKPLTWRDHGTGHGPWAKARLCTTEVPSSSDFLQRILHQRREDILPGQDRGCILTSWPPIQGRSNGCFNLLPFVVLLIFLPRLSLVVPFFCRWCRFHAVPSSSLRCNVARCGRTCGSCTAAGGSSSTTGAGGFGFSRAFQNHTQHAGRRTQDPGRSAQMRQVGAFFKNSFRAWILIQQESHKTSFKDILWTGHPLQDNFRTQNTRGMGLLCHSITLSSASLALSSSQIPSKPSTLSQHWIGKQQNSWPARLLMPSVLKHG